MDGVRLVSRVKFVFEGWMMADELVAPKEEHAVTSLPSKSNLLSTSVELFSEGYVHNSSSISAPS